MAKKKKELDPDRLALSKKDILEFCDRVLQKWNTNPKKHAQNILAMNAVKMSIVWTDENALKAIWNEILRWSFELMYKNAMAQANKDNVDWSQVLGKIKDQ